MLNKYRLFRRGSGVFYCQDNESGQQRSLWTKDRRAAEKLLHVKNEAHRLPTLNLTVARAYKKKKKTPCPATSACTTVKPWHKTPQDCTL